MAISGLTEAQHQALAGVKAGDFLLINHVPQQLEESDDGRAETSDDDIGSDPGTEIRRANGPETTNVQHTEQTGPGQLSSEAQIEEPTDDDVCCHPGDHADLMVANMYIVTSVCRNAVGQLSSIHIYVSSSSNVEESISWSLHRKLYGRSLTHEFTAHDLAEMDTDDDMAFPINDMICPLDTILINPDGDTTMRMIYTDHGRRCPGRCINGWLEGIEHLRGLVPADYDIPTALDHRPVCPVCVGLEHSKAHQTLRSQLEAHHNLDFIFDAVLDFYATLNTRRRDLGLPFKQFDEREWGFEFYDMIPDGSDEDENAEVYEEWDEANDPNAHRVINPTSPHLVDALPRKLFAEVKGEEAGQTCLICTDAFEEERQVVVLGCKHIFCEECIKIWLLRQSNTCPTCRTKVAEPEEVVQSAVSGASNAEGSLEIATTSNASTTGNVAGSINMNNGDVAMGGGLSVGRTELGAVEVQDEVNRRRVRWRIDHSAD